MKTGENEVLSVVFNSPIIIQGVLGLGDLLKKGNRSICDIIADLDDEDNEIDEESYGSVFLEQVERIRKIYNENLRHENALATKKDLTETRKKNLRQKIDKNKESIFTLSCRK